MAVKKRKLVASVAELSEAIEKLGKKKRAAKSKGRRWWYRWWKLEQGQKPEVGRKRLRDGVVRIKLENDEFEIYPESGRIVIRSINGMLCAVPHSSNVIFIQERPYR